MRSSTTVLISIAVAATVGCAPGGGDANSGNNGVQGDGSGGATTGSGAGGQGNGNGSGSGGTSFTGPPTRDAAGADAACGEFTAIPEQVTVLVDASYTDTVFTYSPIALYIMQDRSSSMVGVLGDPLSWTNASGAVGSFVNDPSSAGVEVGLGVFPPMTPPATPEALCKGTACSTPVVPIAPLPQNAAAITNGMVAATPPTFPPLFTPTECALHAMIEECVEHSQRSSIPCAAILVTDGNPTECSGADFNYSGLVDIVAQGRSQDVLTFVLGLPGANINFLNQLAQAGGTNVAVDLTSGGQQAILNALNSIRETVATVTTTPVTTTKVIETPLDCQWGIPEPRAGEEFDKEKVNVQFSHGGQKTKYGYVASEGECSGVVDGWYYDDSTNPTQVLVCPQTCNTIKNTSGGRIDLLIGCKREEAIR